VHSGALCISCARHIRIVGANGAAKPPRKSGGVACEDRQSSQCVPVFLRSGPRRKKFCIVGQDFGLWTVSSGVCVDARLLPKYVARLKTHKDSRAESWEPRSDNLSEFVVRILPLGSTGMIRFNEYHFQEDV
jgi:hypothetical protein